MSKHLLVHENVRANRGDLHGVVAAIASNRLPQTGHFERSVTSMPIPLANPPFRSLGLRLAILQSGGEDGGIESQKAERDRRFYGGECAASLA
jgi:hypothetical protein